MEEIDNEYFMDLLLRSFFQEAEMDEFGNIIKCKMHDLMHDLAISVAGSLITTFDDTKRNIDKKVRHVSVAYNINISHEVSTLLCKASRMRTFLCFGNNFEANIDCDATFSSSKFLHVLDLYNKWPVDCSIKKLKHLRYLDLSGNIKGKKLLDSITNLQNLQTLILSDCQSLEELPGDIKKLVNLRHLEIDGCNLSYMPLGLGQLTNLQTLSTFFVCLDSHSRHRGSTGLQELKELNKLRGELKIVNLGHKKGVASECKAASLNEKQHLRTLHIWWSAEGDVENSDVVEDEVSLKGFQPHSNLKKLFLRDYQGSKLPSWILLLTNLVRFELNECNRCRYLPPLSQLPSLKELSLMDLEAIEYILDDGDSNEFSSSSTAPTPFFPSLKYIQLYYCPNLKGWWRRRDSSVEANSDSDNSVEMTEHHLLPCFPCLSKLVIESCPMLTSMPMVPHLEEELVLTKASSKPLQQTMMMNMAASQSPTSTATNSSSFSPLSKLKNIKLSFITDLETLPLQNLTSLESLKIDNCNKLKSLYLGITSLQKLRITYCYNLELANDEDGIQWQGLTSLLSIHFLVLPKLVSLPSGLQHATTLQELVIQRCESLTAIPEWIHNCKSLQLLDIRGCSRLASLPEGMRRLTSLQRLTIVGCPNLELANDEDGMQWQGLTSLISIHLSVLPKLVSLPSGLQRATTLQKLEIWRCESLTTIPKWIHNCKSLQLLEICYCFRLASLPKGISQLTSLQTLDIVGCPNLELANDEDGMQWQGLTSLLSLSFSGLTKLVSLPSGLQHATTLQKLEILWCWNLTAIPEWIHNCKSLQLLKIRGCPNLASLPEGISRLTYLQTLDIKDCPDLELATNEDGMQWQGLTSLLSLWFSSLPKLVSLPSGLQHATTLQKLMISDCESLMAIPEWIHNCKSLQLLEISGCSRLASLPKGMCRLTSLQRLTIEGCPILLQRCKRHTGEDWPKIAHIPGLNLRYPP